MIIKRGLSFSTSRQFPGIAAESLPQRRVKSNEGNFDILLIVQARRAQSGLRELKRKIRAELRLELLNHRCTKVEREQRGQSRDRGIGSFIRIGAMCGPTTRGSLRL